MDQRDIEKFAKLFEELHGLLIEAADVMKTAAAEIRDQNNITPGIKGLMRLIHIQQELETIESEIDKL